MKEQETEHFQSKVYIEVDERLSGIIQILYDHYGAILPIASCEDDGLSGMAYIFVSALSLTALDKFIADTGSDVMVEYYSTADGVLIPRWRISWECELTSLILDHLKVVNG